MYWYHELFESDSLLTMALLQINRSELRDIADEKRHILCP